MQVFFAETETKILLERLDAPEAIYDVLKAWTRDDIEERILTMQRQLRITNKLSVDTDMEREIMRVLSQEAPLGPPKNMSSKEMGVWRTTLIRITQKLRRHGLKYEMAQ